MCSWKVFIYSSDVLELFLNFHLKNCWLPWECNFNKNSRFMSSRSSCKVSNANVKFQFIFWNTNGNFSFEAYRQLVLHFTNIYTHTCICHIKPSKLQKWVFCHYKTWVRMLISVCFRPSTGKLDTNDTKLHKKEKFWAIIRKEKLL